MPQLRRDHFTAEQHQRLTPLVNSIRPAGRAAWSPEGYGDHAAAIDALVEHLIDRWGRLGELNAMFELQRSRRLREECAIRFGLFPSEPTYTIQAMTTPQPRSAPPVMSKLTHGPICSSRRKK